MIHQLNRNLLSLLTSNRWRAGLLDALGRDRDKLAVVLGHEASHVLARHSAEGVGMRIVAGLVVWAVGSAVGKAVLGMRRENECAPLMWLSGSVLQFVL